MPQALTVTLPARGERRGEGHGASNPNELINREPYHTRRLDYVERSVTNPVRYLSEILPDLLRVALHDLL